MAVQQSGVVFTFGEFGEWEKVSGGIPTASFVEHFQAGSRTPEHLPGTVSYTDLTVERAYEPTRDQRVVDWHKRFMMGQDFPRNGVKQIRNYQGIVVNTESYAGLMPVSVETPEGVAGDNTVAMIKVVLRVSQKL